MVRTRIAGIFLVFFYGTGMLAAQQPARAGLPVLASVRLRNPTAWKCPFPIEVPVGRLATPGIIDWRKVRLLAAGGQEIPFSVREGRAHWKARLISPVVSPRPEDLLVFSCAMTTDAWTQIDVVPGSPHNEPALVEKTDRLEISYPQVWATVERTTGQLVQFEAFGESLLDGPLSLSFSRTFGNANDKKSFHPRGVRLAAKSSNAALTELHFVLEVSDRLALSLSYRFHACGVVEIWMDERLWSGVSPWIDHQAEIRLPLTGPSEPLPLLVNRAPFYGFKDFAAAVKHVAQIHRGSKSLVLVLGEETTNGRRWQRRLYPLPAEKAAAISHLVELANEGPIVDILPAVLPLTSKEVVLADTTGTPVLAQLLSETLQGKGLRVKVLPTGTEKDAQVVCRFRDPAQLEGIDGDGYEIRPLPEKTGISITAGTRFGLIQAVQKIRDFLSRPDLPPGWPLVASNPVVSLRGAGFGGGDFEVDFPYGTEAEWHQALDPLIASGMNLMADLGMWSNWKMPVSYRDMPELRSDDPGAYDEVSGAKLSELALHRDRGKRLLKYLHDRGVRVWLWLPVGCVPTTYAAKHPDAMAPGKTPCPCFTHPLYNRYLQAFLTELLATYPIDGIVMIRDDNGGLCPCPRCQAYVARSRTHSAAWEQYLLLYEWLKKAGFRGDIAVYPYFDHYQARLEPLLPADLFIVGHGSGAAVLTRAYEKLAPMGDTWLDNVMAGFRVPTAARMKRLLGDRNSFWLGGALRTSELPWLALGQFGWTPTDTVNSLRYQTGRQRFGEKAALCYVTLAQSYEELWEIYDLPMLPHEWVKMSARQRQDIAARGWKNLHQFRERLEALKRATETSGQDAWFRHLALFGTYFAYHLRRLEIISEMQSLALANREALTKPEGLAPKVREGWLARHRETLELAEKLDREMATVPGNMLAQTRAMQLTRPFKELVNGYDPSLDALLAVKQFAGTLDISPLEVAAGQPFVLRVRLQNTGFIPWMPGMGQRLQLGEGARRLKLPAAWDFQGPWMVFGDWREIELRGVAPKEAGECQLQVLFLGGFRNPHPCCQKTATIRWK